MEKDIECFLESKSLLEASGILGEDLVCKVGDYPALKILKSTWTNDTHDRIGNDSGVFFSVWMSTLKDEEEMVLYNIHALKLRQLAGYRLESRKFAFAFRDEFLPHAEKWPNVRTNLGPQTLMQGWIPRRPSELPNDIFNLAHQFGDLIPIIDRLLNEATRKK